MPRIAVFTKNRTNPAYEAARLGADRTAARLGATTVHYVPDTPDSVPEQIALIARAIAAAARRRGVRAGGRDRRERRHPRASTPRAFRCSTSSPAPRRAGAITFVGSDDRALARDIARYLFGKLFAARHDHHPRRHARLRHQPRAAPGISGCAGRASRRQCACSLRGDYQRNIARDVFLRAKNQWPGVDAVLCANDVMALGVLDALEAGAGPRAPLFMAGVNAIPEAVAAIAAGRMLATADFNAMAMSEIATEAAVRHLRGETIPPEIMLPVQIVDAANCAAWNAPFEARPSPVWDDVVRR